MENLKRLEGMGCISQEANKALSKMYKKDIVLRKQIENLMTLNRDEVLNEKIYL